MKIATQENSKHQQVNHYYPKHIAIIMDGNGRYALEQGLQRFWGHEAGVAAVREVIEACYQRGIEVLSLFAFSSENWVRPLSEVHHIQKLMLEVLRDDAFKLQENNIQLRIIGDISRFDEELQQTMISTQQATKKNTGMKLLIAANYGGQWDIIQAVKLICQDVLQGHLKIEEISNQHLQAYLSTADLPPPDLLIRTSGEQRISNFFIWQLAYTELYFTNKWWPNFSAQDLDEAINFFKSRKRRFGDVKECVAD